MEESQLCGDLLESRLPGVRRQHAPARSHPDTYGQLRLASHTLDLCGRFPHVSIAEDFLAYLERRFQIGIMFGQIATAIARKLHIAKFEVAGKSALLIFALVEAEHDTALLDEFEKLRVIERSLGLAPNERPEDPPQNFFTDSSF